MVAHHIVRYHQSRALSIVADREIHPKPCARNRMGYVVEDTLQAGTRARKRAAKPTIVVRSIGDDVELVLAGQLLQCRDVALFQPALPILARALGVQERYRHQHPLAIALEGFDQR